MNVDKEATNRAAVAAASAIALMGAPVAAARLLGLHSHQTAQQWLRNGVPFVHCRRVEAGSGVSRRDLRPCDWHLIWSDPAEGVPPVPASAQEAARA